MPLHWWDGCFSRRQARQAVRQNVFHNVDVIKVTAEENLTVPELAAAIEEAHRNHLRVAVHAVDKASIQTAIDAGADSIEHGDEATEDQPKRMRDKGMFLDFTPTSYGDFFTRIFERIIAMSLELRPIRLDSDERTRQRYDDLAQRLKSGAKFPDESDERENQRYNSLVQRVLKSGVKFAAGSEIGWFYPGKTRGQASVSRFPFITIRFPRARRQTFESPDQIETGTFLATAVAAIRQSTK